MKRAAPVWTTSSKSEVNNDQLSLFNSFTKQKVNTFLFFEVYFIQKFKILRKKGFLI